MKSIKAVWCLWIAIALTQVGCTSQLFIERTLPPQVRVTNDQWKVVVMNRYNANLLPFKRDKKVEVYADGAMYAFAGVLDAIDADLTYDLVHTDTAAYVSLGTGSRLTPVQVQEIYRKHPHHLFLTLDNFDTYFEKEVEQEQTKTAYYTLSAKSVWTLYDSTGSVLDHVTLTRKEFYDSRGVISGLLAIGPAISNAGPFINALASETGWDYWDRLLPKPVSFVRPYYSNKEFAPAAYQMAAGNWAEAINLLKPLSQNSKKKDAAKAAYNLAVVYEAMGQIDEAKHWAKIASDKNNKLVLMLLFDLERY